MLPSLTRSTSLTLATALLLCGCSLGYAEAPADFKVMSVTDESTFQLADHRGKVVVLHFLLKTECPICLRYTHEYAALSETTPDVVHVFLKPDDESEIKEWSSKINSKGLKQAPAIYRDANAKLADEYSIPNGYSFHGQSVHFPALVALDGEGKELFRYVGKNNTDRMSVKDFNAKLAATMKR
jgi:peroxiredoxin Q/BCP